MRFFKVLLYYIFLEVFFSLIFWLFFLLDTLNNKNESEKIDNILFLTGKEAVVENGNWYMIYKDKEPEVEGIG